MHALVDQNRRLVSAQSTPLLMLDSANGDSQGRLVLSLTLSNVGTGPAQIVWFHVSDSQGVDYLGPALERRINKLDPKSAVASQQIASTLMRSGDDRSVFRWPQPVGNQAALAEWWRVNQIRYHLHAQACYCSIFYECAITEFGESRPKPVESCKQD